MINERLLALTWEAVFDKRVTRHRITVKEGERKMTLYRIIIKKGNRTLHTSVVGFRERRNLCRYRDILLTKMKDQYGNGVVYSILALPQVPKAKWHETESGEIIYSKNAKFSTR